jgi:hypothetical protein
MSKWLLKLIWGDYDAAGMKKLFFCFSSFRSFAARLPGLSLASR